MIPSENPLIRMKSSLLSMGISFDLDFFTSLQDGFYVNQFVYGQTSEFATRTRRFPQALVLGGGLIAACLRREGSPWSLLDGGGQLELWYDGEYVHTIGLPRVPAYFGRTLSDGSLSEDIIAVAGEDTPGFFLYPACAYFLDGTECAFCDMRGARRTVGRHMAAGLSESQITEATQLFQSVDWCESRLVSVSTGTCRSDGDTRKHILRVLRVMRNALDPSARVHLLTHPPQNLGLVEAFRDAGVDTIAFNLEVFDEDQFRLCCPGKHIHYGYAKWLRALDRARDVFGDYNAYCGLVWGLEPVESVLLGYRRLLERGIGIASNVFHADPGCRLRGHPQPSNATILAIADGQAELYRSFPEARTIFNVSMRSTLDWEVHREAHS